LLVFLFTLLGFASGRLYEKWRAENRDKTGIIIGVITISAIILVLIGMGLTAHTIQAKANFPFRVTYRKALLGAGYVEQIRNISDKAQSVKVTLYNPALNRTKVYAVVVDPQRFKEIGHLQGWTATSGDVITLECGGDTEEFKIP